MTDATPEPVPADSDTQPELPLPELSLTQSLYAALENCPAKPEHNWEKLCRKGRDLKRVFSPINERGDIDITRSSTITALYVHDVPEYLDVYIQSRFTRSQRDVFFEIVETLHRFSMESRASVLAGTPANVGTRLANGLIKARLLY